MQEVVIVEAVRSPIGRRKGGLSGLHPADLLGAVQRAAVERAGVDPGAVGQIIGGCVSQVGEQSFNIARTAWLAQGFPMEVAATTVDSQCGSSQQATSLAAGLIGAGIEDLVLACGVEMMTRVPLGANMKGGSPLPKSYARALRLRVAVPGRRDDRARSTASRARTPTASACAARRWPIQAWQRGPLRPRGGADRRPRCSTPRASRPARRRPSTRDEGLRETSLEKLAALKPVEPGGVHTAGTSSQVSDGAAAVLLASPERAQALGLKPRARIVTTTLVGVDPVTMLKGPIPATRKVLKAAGLSIDDIDEFEVNEAFASVVLAWMKELRPQPRAGQSQRRRHRARPSHRLHGRAPDHHGAARARAHAAALRADRDVLRRRPRHRHDHRTV